MASMNAPLNGASATMRTVGRTEAVLVGASATMQEVFRLADRVSSTDATVLITGESGSGKQVIARLIHDRSPRVARPFVAINCGAIQSDLTGAEMFGYQKGSSVGEGRSRAGMFERAEGGTLFLDEVTEMPAEMQSRLLRVLEMGTYLRAGGVTEISANVRVIAAANCSPHGAVQKGRLRDELLYRLAVFPIAVPPLRDRGDDAMLLADRFLADLNARDRTNKRFSADTPTVLKQHSWPGNVRELRNCVERAFIVADEIVEPAPMLVNAAVAERGAVQRSADRLEIRVGARIDEVERSLIEATLLHYRGNKRRAADTLGCSLKTLYNKLHSYSQSQQGLVNAWPN